jgi:hypothetical protein
MQTIQNIAIDLWEPVYIAPGVKVYLNRTLSSFPVYQLDRL